MILRPVDILAISGILVAFWATKTFVKYVKLRNQTGRAPGPKLLFSAATAFTRLLPNIPGINRKSTWTWEFKHDAFKRYGQDVLAAFAFYPSPRLMIHIADPHVIKEITSHRLAFQKPTLVYKITSYFGSNVLAAEGDEWKRHRKVVAKSFTEQNNKLVWQETVNIVLDLFSEWEKNACLGEIRIKDTAALTKDLTLMVISTAAFGMKLSWGDDGACPPGHSMTFKKTLHFVGNGLVHRIVLPDWILNLYQLGRDTKTAYSEFPMYMREMIDHRMTSPEGREDVFSNLLKAREEEKDGAATLSDSDLLGNIFVLLFAGHETSATTLAFALSFLAIYPEVQAKWLEQIRQCVKPGQLPTYADIPKLNYGLAIIHETLRLQPIVPSIPRQAMNDTQFSTRKTNDEACTVPVPAGAGLLINVVALHYHPTYWDRPHEFMPERFLGEYHKDAWLPFFAGARACIGRRFAEIELLAALALIVQHYEINVTPNPKFARESQEEQRARLLDIQQATFILRAKEIGLTFKKRTVV
ncbi:hypothetical protein FRC20_010287 [Serendipita sp. 405]|nr:hypothetical protein FRC20_010287 [Serendipita sp. 405]